MSCVASNKPFYFWLQLYFLTLPHVFNFFRRPPIPPPLLPSTLWSLNPLARSVGWYSRNPDVIIRALCVLACRWKQNWKVGPWFLSWCCRWRRSSTRLLVGTSPGRCTWCRTCACPRMYILPKAFPRWEKRRGDDKMGTRKWTSLW